MDGFNTSALHPYHQNQEFHSDMINLKTSSLKHVQRDSEQDFSKNRRRLYINMQPWNTQYKLRLSWRISGAEPLKSWACRFLTTSQGPPTPWLLLKKHSNPALIESAQIKETSMQNYWWPSTTLQQKPYWPAAAQCGVLAAQQQTKRLFKESVTQHKKSLAASCPHWKTSPAQHEQSKEKGRKSTVFVPGKLLL